MRSLKRKHITLLALVVLIAVAPLFFPSAFYYRVGTLMFINGLAVTGLVVLIGYAGQISLGHAGFSGIGAYACALGPLHLGLPPAASLVFGAVLSGGIAWLVGRPILRLKGHYLAVATLGFGILVSMVLTNEAHLTGGPDGMAVEDLGLRAALREIGISVRAPELWYWFSGLVLLAGAWLVLNLQDSPTGRALRSLHDSEIAARTVGVDVARYKLTAFVISAVYASVAGSLLAMMNRFVSPDIAGFLHSIQMVTMTVLGGAGTVLGAVTGASILTALPQVLTVFHDYEHIVLGLIMMLVMIFLREGLVPSLAKLFGRRER
ncbi:branched-chain amino acid ABC transporter permease [Polymorphum gilvum]|uniref:Putative amino acid or sugar ABC transport system, permease protein n=1 Tax=Polymorphum gilvum (strain LMG 25793 / CGMCC 1.9160 / SL003B-26A1) TaxID=991905 RepID=F2IYW8_POLGS|nr:branched-chain amino acid ABC transporter permease [Polymorphum gilvum]ADZ70583.1 Putative amino acid or sugar ABC transport system, permease protein [Polymorphum gilvum SL003B-26A1]